MTGNRAIDAALVVVYVIGVWTIAFLAIAHATGWRRLAGRFPARPILPESVRGIASITLGSWGNYNNCVLWASDDEHLHLRLMPGFNLFHAPISIPWAMAPGITMIERGMRRGWVLVRVGGERLTLPGKVVRRELALRARIAEMEAAKDDRPKEADVN